MQTLRARGVTPSLYLERFGGFGKTRDLGFLAWQVALAMDHMQQDNFPAAKDALSLLFVCLEQSAMDGGKLDIGIVGFGGGSTTEPFQFQVSGSLSEPETLRTIGAAEVGNGGSSISEGDGHTCNSTNRSHGKECQQQEPGGDAAAAAKPSPKK